jgi:hypothetical protein
MVTMVTAASQPVWRCAAALPADYLSHLKGDYLLAW